MRQTKFGPQPVKQLIAEGPLPLNRLAEAIGCTRAQLYHTARGNQRPSPKLVKVLCEYFEAEAKDLFTEEVLAVRFRKHPKGARKGVKS